MNKNLTLHDFVVNSWNDYLLSSRITEESTKEKKFYASDAGKCLRMRWLKRKGIKGEYGVDTYYAFEHGNYIHGLGAKAFEASQLLISTEQRLEDEHFVCRYDGKLKNPINSKHTPYELKSTNPYVMKRLTSGGADNLENVMQSLTALIMDKEDKNLDESVIVVYINKLPSDKIDPTVIYTRQYFLKTYKKDLLEDRDKIIDYWLSDKIPPCTCPSWSIQKYNAFYMFCRMTDKEINKHLGYLKTGKRISTNGFEITIKDPEQEGVIDHG